MTAVMALGGSTNAVIYLVALARRSGVSLDLTRFDEKSRRVPVLANIRPTGEYLMEDFYYAGGLRGLLSRLEKMLHLDRTTAGGHAMGETLTGVYNDAVIRSLDDPLQQEGGIAVLRGNLTPDGCVIKHSAADPGLLKHYGPAVVFDGYEDMDRRIDDPNLKVGAGVETAPTTLRSRLRCHLRRARDPGQRGLRFRLPRPRTTRPGARDPLTLEL